MTPTPVDLMAVEKRHQMRRHSGALEHEVRQRWGLSGTRWAQLVLTALDSGAAYEVDATTAALVARRIAGRRRGSRGSGGGIAVP